MCLQKRDRTDPRGKYAQEEMKEGWRSQKQLEEKRAVKDEVSKGESSSRFTGRYYYYKKGWFINGNREEKWGVSRGSSESDENQMDRELGARKGGDKCNKMVQNPK